MTKPQRVALAAVPVLSVGLLCWLPLLYLWLRDPARHRPRLVMTVLLFISTALLSLGLVTSDPDTVRAQIYGLVWIWMVVLATVLAWFDSRPVDAPVKDPYA